MKINREIFKTEVLKERGNFQTKYNKFMEKPASTAWCASFVCYVMLVIANIPDFPKSASCSILENTDFFKKRRNTAFETAEVGDIITYDWNKSNNDGADHIGIVIENDEKTGMLRVIEGNFGNKSNESTQVDVRYVSWNYSCFRYIYDMSDFFCNNIDRTNEYRVFLETIKGLIEQELNK